MLKKLLTTAALASLATGAAADITTMSWDEIVVQAQEEGELTWYVWYLQDDFRQVVQAFEEEYGITVTIPEGTKEANFAKMIAERDRDAGDIDVFPIGWESYETINLEDFFYPLSVLPNDDGRVTDLGGFDAQGYAVAYWGNQTGIAYEPSMIAAEDLPQTPDQFAAFWAANPGKFGFNYENGGSGPSYIENMLRVASDTDWSDPSDSEERLAEFDAGIEFFNASAENYVITSSNADSITRISDGELWMAPAWEDHLAGLQRSNEVRSDIAFYIPEMGMNGGGNGVSIPLNAQHPAAAAVFINWLTSPETQTMFNVQFGTALMNAAADDSKALVPSEQRVFSTNWAPQPLANALMPKFIEEVVQER